MSVEQQFRDQQIEIALGGIPSNMARDEFVGQLLQRYPSFRRQPPEVQAAYRDIMVQLVGWREISSQSTIFTKDIVSYFVRQAKVSGVPSHVFYGESGFEAKAENLWSSWCHEKFERQQVERELRRDARMYPDRDEQEGGAIDEDEPPEPTGESL